MAVIASVESAMISRVEDVLGSSVRSVQSLSGPWTMSALQRALQFAPCVRLAFLGGTGTRADDASINARWGVYLVAGHAKDEQRRHGKGSVIGLYDMLELVAPALNEFTVQGVGSLYLERVAQAFTEQTLQMGGAVYELLFSMPNVVLPDADPSAALADFVTFHADTDITGDGAPEITTEETLPQ